MSVGGMVNLNFPSEMSHGVWECVCLNGVLWWTAVSCVLLVCAPDQGKAVTKDDLIIYADRGLAHWKGCSGQCLKQYWCNFDWLT